MNHIFNYFYCLFSKQWSKRLCAFFTTFIVVMTILILSTDVKVGRHYIEFNSSYIWDFEESPQESVELIELITKEYIFPPDSFIQSKVFTGEPSIQILNIFGKKRFGVFMECGSDGHGDTEWLERVLSWRGLLTQPHPESFSYLHTVERSRSHLAQVCISPSIHPKHALFKNASHNESLTAIPCFSIYSLMKAYNTSKLDLLSLNQVISPLQVLKTLPVGDVRIEVISIKNSEVYENKPDLMYLLDRWGYKVTTPCIDPNPTCYFVCSRNICPSLLLYS